VTEEATITSPVFPKLLLGIITYLECNGVKGKVKVKVKVKVKQPRYRSGVAQRVPGI